MRQFTGYTRGMGLGGWLTNYKRMGQLPEELRMVVTVGDLEHFDSYITERDVAYIASLGVDHIRLAFDQLVLEVFDQPYTYREEVFAHIDDFLGWAKKYGLNVILNLHKAYGCYCDVHDMKPLLDTPAYMDRFVALWLEFERRYHSFGREICFELLNELVGGNDSGWNALWHRTVAEIRKRNPDRLIMIGSSQWNSVNTLMDLDVIDDPNVVYTFHMYAPFEFTHQRGVLQRMNHYYNREMPWPGDIERYRHCLSFVHHCESPYENYTEMGRQFIRDSLSPVLTFMEAHPDAIVTCGEFGTIRSCPIEWRENYFSDVIGFLDEHGIPFTIWNYLSTPYDANRFSLVDDDHRKIVSEKIADLIRIPK